MGELRVGAIGDDRRRQPGRVAIARNPGQECGQPAGERRWRQDAPHEVRLGQAGRQEILARGFVAQGAVAIRGIEAVRGIREQRAHLHVAGNSCPVPDQTERKGGLIVLADADRIVQFRQPRFEAGGGLGFERAQSRRPLLCPRVVPLPQLGAKLEQPRKAVRPLE